MSAKARQPKKGQQPPPPKANETPLKTPVVPDVKTPVVPDVKTPVVPDVKTPVVPDVKTPVVSDVQPMGKQLFANEMMADPTDELNFSVFSQIKNFYYITIPDYDTESASGEKSILVKKEKMEFTWSNINLQFANTYRRILISEIPTYVLGNFRSHNFSIPSTGSSHLFEMSRLQPVMHNEQLSLVLELIPINQTICKTHFESGRNIWVTYGYIQERDQIEPKSLQIMKPIQNIYTSDLIIFVVDSNKKVVGSIKNDAFFHRKVLITKLKVNQKLAFITEPILGVGNESAKFCPVCSASYEYNVEDFQTTDSAKSLYEKTYETETLLSPVTVVKFTIHSLPYYTPEQVALLGFEYFEKVFLRFKEKINHLFEDDHQQLALQIQISEQKYVTLTIEIENENYTVGNIFQHYLLKQKTRRISYAACIIEHPKIKKLKCKATIENYKNENKSTYIPDFKEIFEDTINDIIKNNNTARENFKKKFKITE
jgi:DNA-directed RNA polymerase alpha subunit/DNA-directed RNA polymerase subunit L